VQVIAVLYAKDVEAAAKTEIPPIDREIYVINMIKWKVN
jgi:hypothetical protein